MRTQKKLLSLLFVLFLTSQISLSYSQVINEAERNDTICNLNFKYQYNDTIVYLLNPRCGKSRFSFPDIQNAVILTYSTEDPSELIFSTIIKNGNIAEKEFRKFNDYEFQNILWDEKGKMLHMFSSVILPDYSLDWVECKTLYDNIIGTSFIYDESLCLRKIIYSEKKRKKIVTLNCEGMIENIESFKIKRK